MELYIKGARTKKVGLSLTQRDGHVLLEAQDEEGLSQILLEVHPNGIKLVGCVSPELGFPLDSRDAVVLC